MSVIYRALRNLEKREANTSRGILHTALLNLEHGQESTIEQAQPIKRALTKTVGTGVVKVGAGIEKKGFLASLGKEKQKEKIGRLVKKLTGHLSSLQRHKKDDKYSPKAGENTLQKEAVRPKVAEKIFLQVAAWVPPQLRKKLETLTGIRTKKAGAGGPLTPILGETKPGSSLVPTLRKTGGRDRFIPILAKLSDRVKRAQIGASQPKQTQDKPSHSLEQPKIKEKRGRLVPVLLTVLVGLIGSGAWIYTVDSDISNIVKASLSGLLGEESYEQWMAYQAHIGETLQPIMPYIAWFWPGADETDSRVVVTLEDSQDQKGASAKKPTLEIEQTATPTTTLEVEKMETSATTLEIEQTATPTTTLEVEKMETPQPKGTDSVQMATTVVPQSVDTSRVPESEARAKAEEKKAEEKKAEEAASMALEQKFSVPEMVVKLREGIAQGDENKVNKWFDALLTVKKTDDSYLLNMRAYWHITQQEYKKAETYLKQVLLQNSEDLEAGLNLAIVEMHTNRAEHAQQRLHILSQRYPSESRLQHVLNTLR